MNARLPGQDVTATVGWARGGIDCLAGLTRLDRRFCNRRSLGYPSLERGEVLDILDVPDLLLAVPACAQCLDLVFFCEGGDQVDAHEGIICMAAGLPLMPCARVVSVLNAWRR